MSNLFWNTISENMKQVLLDFMQSEIGSRFYLAGGTALSLQMGHRLSVDLDFFSQTEDIPSIRSQLENTLAEQHPQVVDSSWGNLVFLVNNVRVGFYGYGFPLLAPLITVDNIRLASIVDIGLMKLDTLLSRASRKDFYDLYAICQKISLKSMFEKSHQKYPSVRDFEAQVTKRLIFFENAEKESQPELIQKVSWQDVKLFFIQQAKEIEKSWLQ